MRRKEMQGTPIAFWIFGEKVIDTKWKCSTIFQNVKYRTIGNPLAKHIGCAAEENDFIPSQFIVEGRKNKLCRFEVSGYAFDITIDTSMLA